MNKIFKKTVLLIILVITFLFSNNIVVNAASGHVYGRYPTRNSYHDLKFKLKGVGTKEFQYVGVYYVKNGDTYSQVFCIDPSQALNNGAGYDVSATKNLDSYTGVSKTEYIEYILNFATGLTQSELAALSGLSNSNDAPSGIEKYEKVMAAQGLIWEVLQGERTSFQSYVPDGAATGTTGGVYNSFYALISSVDAAKGIFNEYKAIVDDIKNTAEDYYIGDEDKKYNSFTYWGNTSAILAYNNKLIGNKYQTKITDGNMNFKYYTATTPQNSVNVSISSSGDSITLSTNSTIAQPGKQVVINLKTHQKSCTVPTVYTNSNLQDVVELCSISFPERSIKVYTGTLADAYQLKLKKVDSLTGDPVEGATFDVYKCSSIVGRGLDVTYQLIKSLLAGSGASLGDIWQIAKTAFQGGSNLDSLCDTTIVMLSNKYTSSILSKAKIDTITSDSSGYATSTKIPEPGMYYIKETGFPEGYNEGSVAQVVNVTESSYVGAPNSSDTVPTIKNTPTYTGTYHLTVRKVDKKTKKGLAGAIFKVYKCSSVADMKCTEPVGQTTPSDEDGYAAIAGLPEMTKYKIEELIPPVGYKISNPSAYYKTITPADADDPELVGQFDRIIANLKNLFSSITTITFENSEIDKSYQIRITKVEKNASKYLEGAEFKICKDSNCSNVLYEGTTNQDGVLSYNGISEAGVYYVKETKAPIGYKLNEEIKAVEVKEVVSEEEAGEEGAGLEESKYYLGEITIEDEPDVREEYNYQAKIKKVGFNGKLLSGVKFKLCNNAVCSKKIAEATTNSNGIATFTGITEPGTYYVIEESVISGYVKNSVATEVVVTAADKEGSNSTVKVINNTPTIFNLIKYTVDEAGNKVKLSDGCGTSNYTGPEFELRDGNNNIIKLNKLMDGIYELSSNASSNKETVIKTCNGEFNVYTLPKGTYVIEETKAPTIDGVTIELPSTTKHTFTINEVNGTAQVTITNGFKGIEFQKLGEDGNYLGGGKYTLQQKENGIYKDMLVKLDGDVYKYDTTLTSETDGATYFMSNSTGIYLISGVPQGEYRIVEKEAPDGYQLIAAKDSKSLVTINAGGENDYYLVQMIDKKENINGSTASAELVVTITTGRRVLNYVLILSVLGISLVVLLIVRKKMKK